MPYVKLSNYSPRYTYMRPPEVKGLTTRQVKAVRKFIGRHKKELGGMSSG